MNYFFNNQMLLLYTLIDKCNSSMTISQCCTYTNVQDAVNCAAEF